MRQPHVDLENVFPDRRGEGFQYQQLPDGTIEVDDPTNGMITSIPRDKIPPGSWSLLKNARTRQDWTGRRPGTAIIGNKPNAEPIVNLVTFVNEAENIGVVRITKNTSHVTWGAGVWSALIDDLTGQESRFDVARMFDWLFFANGEEKIRYIDFPTMKFQIIAEAPKAKTVTNFGDRIVAANLRLPIGGVRPNGIAWSANSDPFDWTSESAGEDDLVQGQGGYGDPIVRLFGMGTEMIILRKRSIWHGSRQPFAAAPFKFQEIISGLGCDLPFSAVEVEGGIIFADQRTKGVYFYRLGARPERISQVIEKEIFQDLSGLSWAQGVYDPFEKEYHLGLSTSVLNPWITKTWVFSVEKKAWSYDIGPTVSAMSIVSTPDDLVTIDDLVGNIDAQVGTIDELNAGGLIQPRLFKGTATGEFLSQTYGADEDWDETAFEFEAVSQNFGSPSRRRTVKDLLVKLTSLVVGVVTLEHSITASSWRPGKDINIGPALGEQRVRLPKKLTTGPKIFWRIRCSVGQPRIYGYWIRLLEKGLQR